MLNRELEAVYLWYHPGKIIKNPGTEVFPDTQSQLELIRKQILLIFPFNRPCILERIERAFSPDIVHNILEVLLTLLPTADHSHFQRPNYGKILLEMLDKWSKNFLGLMPTPLPWHLIFWVILWPFKNIPWFLTECPKRSVTS